MNKKSITKETWIYLAGFLDGEGYFGLIPRAKGSSWYVPKIKVANTNRNILVWLQNIFGGHLDKPRFQNMPNRKPASMWTLSNKKAVGLVLENIKNYSIVKKPQIKILLSYCKKAFYKNAHTINKGVVDREKRWRKKSYLSIRQLNFRGIPPAETE